LSRRALNLGGEAGTHQAVLSIELLAGLYRVVDACKGSGLATTESGAQAEYGNLLGGGLVEAGELGLEVGLGDTGLFGVDDVAGK
jgi:hypothetical protein